MENEETYSRFRTPMGPIGIEEFACFDARVNCNTRK